MPIVLYVAVSMTIFCVVALLLTPNLFRPSPEVQRIVDVAKSIRPDQPKIGRRELAQSRLISVAAQLWIHLGLAENPRLKTRIRLYPRSLIERRIIMEIITRVVCGVMAVAVMGIIVYRRKQKTV